MGRSPNTGSDDHEPHVGSRIHGVTIVEQDPPTSPLLQVKTDVSPSAEYIQDISRYRARALDGPGSFVY